MLTFATRSHEALLKDDSSALGHGFDNTKGFIYRFSDKGIPRLREAKWAKCLLPFFDKARDDGVNGEGRGREEGR